MARLSGVDLPREKRIEVALTYIFGIGRTRARQSLSETGVSPDTRVRDLSEDDLVKLNKHIEANYRIEGDLRREVQADIRRKVEILLRGSAAPSRPARARSADPHERAYPQGPEARDRR